MWRRRSPVIGASCRYVTWGADPGAYGTDRLFIYLELAAEPDENFEKGLRALAAWVKDGTYL